MSNIVTPTVSDFIAALDQTQSTNTYDVFVPVLQEYFKFKPLTVNQQKQIIAASAVSATRAYQTPFKEAVKKVISENSPELPVNNLLKYDIDAILVQIRSKTFGSEYKTDKGILNLDLLIEKYKQLDLSKIFGVVPEPEELGIKLTLGVPTYAKEIDYEKLVSKPIENDTQRLGNILSDVYVIEIAKHISAITITDKSFNLYQTTPNIALSIVEKIPSSLFTVVLDQTNEFKRRYDDLTKFDKTNVNIEIDATFFATK